MSEERPTLDTLIEAAKNHEMTLDEEMEQRISWAVGMRSLDNVKTPEEVRQIVLATTMEGRLYSALLESRAENARLREALTDIGVYGCGMLNQPVELNGPVENWLRQRIAEYERVARAALEQE